MKVIQVVTSDVAGGAARAASRLNESINISGNKEFSSNMLVGVKKSDDKSVVSICDNSRKKLSFHINYQLNLITLKKYSGNALFSNNVFGMNVYRKIAELKPDIINFHWIDGGLISYKNLKKIIDLNIPIVWTLHDMEPFTGGCHYDEDCRKYTGLCKQCPILKSNKEKDLSFKIQSKKKDMFKKANINIVGCSSWIANCAKDSYLFNDKICTSIPNAIDHNVFKPMDKKIAKNVLNIETDKKIILYGAASISDKRKGYDYLKDAIARLDFNKYYLVIFGTSNSIGYLDSIIETKYLGNLKDDYTLMLAYNAADVFIAPSLQENLANTVMESLSCGTPVVAFKVGGMGDMIEHKKNGYLSDYKSSEDLAKGIEWVTNQNEEMISVNCRDKVINNYTYEIVSSRYCNLYLQLLNK